MVELRRKIAGSALVEVMIATVIVVGCLVASSMLFGRNLVVGADHSSFESLLISDRPNELQDNWSDDREIERTNLGDGLVQVCITVWDENNERLICEQCKIIHEADDEK